LLRQCSNYFSTILREIIFSKIFNDKFSNRPKKPPNFSV
jgi:hypothetical protein